MKRKIAEWKVEKIKEINSLLKSYPIIGVVNMQNLPTLQLQRIKQSLKDKIKLVMTRKRLIKIALEESNLKDLIPYLKGMPALILSKEKPFILFKILKKNKSPAPAKPGQIANKDIIVKAGPTTFPPGPIIGELSQIGVTATVEGGKIVIKEDSTVAKEGEKIKPNVAVMLTKLGIEPMEVGLNLIATYENGEILSKDILDIDEEEYINKIKTNALQSLSLSISISYYIKENIQFLIKKVFNETNSLSKKIKLEEPEEKPKKEEKPEEPTKEVKKEEPKIEKPKGLEEAPKAGELAEEKKEKALKTEELAKKEAPKEEPIKEVKPENKKLFYDKDAFDEKKEKSKITPERILKELKEDEKPKEEEKEIKKLKPEDIIND